MDTVHLLVSVSSRGGFDWDIRTTFWRRETGGVSDVFTFLVNEGSDQEDSTYKEKYQV